MRGIACFLLLAAASFAAEKDKAAPAPRNVDIEALAKRFNITIRVQRAHYRRTALHGDLRYAPADPAKLAKYARVLRDELSIYPQHFVKRSGLRLIVLCTELRFKDQKRSALPDRSRAALVYDIGVAANVGDWAKSGYVRHVIHHEFFHIVDWAGASWRWRLPEWHKLNAPDFKYGKGGHTMQDDSSWSLASGKPGFLNRYSTSSVAEDMAEMYAFLMTRPRAVERRAKDDKILAAKVTLLKRHLRWFSPWLDEKFWDTAAAPRPRPAPNPEVAAPPPPKKKKTAPTDAKTPAPKND